MTDTRTCKTCAITQPIAEFARSGPRNGRLHTCRTCTSQMRARKKAEQYDYGMTAAQRAFLYGRHSI